jgi:hypothetical protein
MNYGDGTILICHTQIKVERFVALFSEDTQGAIDAVNAEEQNSTRLRADQRSLSAGKENMHARNEDSAFEIVRILPPGAYFSLFGVKEYAVQAD